MICEQSGHLTHNPSGTRLGFSLLAATIGLRVFLNHAIRMSAYTTEATEETEDTENTENTETPSWFSFRARHVVPRAWPHAANLPDQIVQRFVARLRIELRRFDDEERRC